MPCSEPWVCCGAVFGELKAWLRMSLPRLGRAAAFLELAIRRADSVVYVVSRNMGGGYPFAKGLRAGQIRFKEAETNAMTPMIESKLSVDASSRTQALLDLRLANGCRSAGVDGSLRTGGAIRVRNRQSCASRIAPNMIKPAAMPG
jgi:hypothetical protein